VAVRHNAIVETLTNAPKTFEPLSAMKLRLSAWAPLRTLADINHGLLLPILFHCVDDQGRPMLGPPKNGSETEQFSRIANKDIPAVVEEMRQYWMPTRFKNR
jgi:uncharacterized protein